MSSEHAFERLLAANPYPTRVVASKPSALEMLDAVRSGTVPRSTRLTDMPAGRPRPRRVTAVWAFVAILLVAVPVLVFVGGDETERAAATTMISTDIDPSTQALVDGFVDTYNAGDVSEFVSLLAPDFSRTVRLDRGVVIVPMDTVLTLYEIDAALDTELSLTCSPGAEAVVCSPTRFDDLHRVLGLPSSEVTDWFLRFEDGLLVEWSETRVNAGVIPYQEAAVAPFTTWVTENHPEVPPLFSGGSDTWVVRDGATDQIAALVREWAESRGVQLDG